jgi:hypothetical protein
MRACAAALLVTCASAAELTFNKSQTTCLNCTAGFEVLAEVLRCNNDTNSEWACTGMPYMHNISVLCMEEPSFLCDKNVCVYSVKQPAPLDTSCKMLYYLKDAQKVWMNDVSVLKLDASNNAASRRQEAKPQIVNLSEGGMPISRLECTKDGISDMGAPVWKCNDIETRRLGGPPITTFRVRCEAYDANTILAGSCRLEYTAKRYTIWYFLMDTTYCIGLVLLFLIVVFTAWYTESGSLLLWTPQTLPKTTIYSSRYHLD